MTDWYPTASIDTLKDRAYLLKTIRTFFDERDVLEVETPMLARFGVTDQHLENFETLYEGQKRCLQTSPEYHMKRLLCAGMPSIYQMAKAFRDEPSGSAHNPEFTLLEWYRLGFDYHDLMQEVADLISMLLPSMPIKHYSYQSLFEYKVEICPFDASLEELKSKSKRLGIDLSGTLKNKDEWLALLMTHVIEPSLKDEGMVFVYDFPATQASLAKIESGVAKRFECYVNSVELANGFEELSDSQQQAARFDKDNELRGLAGLDEKDKDAHLLAALSYGLPACSGVALGIDRLMMLALNKQDISKVISFSSKNA